MGPTILTLPSVLRRIFGEAGARLDDYLDLVRSTRSGGVSSTTARRSTSRKIRTRWRRRSTRSRPARSGAGYREFLDFCARLHGISERHFFWKPIGGLRDMIERKASFDPKMLGDVLAMRMGRSVAGTVRAFTPDPRVAQMIDHFTQYVGSSPEARPPCCAASRTCRPTKASGIPSAARAPCPKRW